MAGKITVVVSLNGSEAQAQAIAQFLQSSAQLTAIDAGRIINVSYESGY